MPSDNARGSKEPIALDDLSGADVTISEAELQIGEKAVAWADVEIVGLSRLAPTSVWSPRPTSRMSIGRRAMDPPVPVFCCTIITRSGIVSNVLSIAMNDSELLIDRAASYRVFVTRLHEHLARAGSDALHLAGAASQQRGLRRAAATAVTTVAALLLLPKPFGLGSSAMIAALILGLAAMVLYLLAREPSPDERFRHYDRAAIPEDFLPPEIQG